MKVAQHTQKGISLAELIVVIAVLGIASAIALPHVMVVTETVDENKARKNAQNLASVAAQARAAGNTQLLQVSTVKEAVDLMVDGVTGEGSMKEMKFAVPNLSEDEQDKALEFLEFTPQKDLIYKPDPQTAEVKKAKPVEVAKKDDDEISESPDVVSPIVVPIFPGGSTGGAPVEVVPVAVGGGGVIASTTLLEGSIDFGGHRYYILPGTMTIAEAHTACADLGGKLITIDSLEELEQFSYMGKQFWIDLSDEKQEGVWVTSRQSRGYTNWYKGHPNGGIAKNRATIGPAGYPMRDVATTSKFHVICEWD